jgi:ABC-type lipoprotein release transport system permease subunit
MILLIKLAFRNLTRNMRRSIITLAAIAVGLMVLILGLTLRTGQYEQMINSGVSQLAGHVVIQHPRFQEEKEPEFLLKNHSELQKQMQDKFPDAQITSRLFLSGLINSTTSPTFAGITAVDPQSEGEVSDFTEKLIKGQWLDDDIKGILIGKNMAETLNVDLGDKLVFTGQYDGEMNSQLFRVKGIFKVGAVEIDSFVAFVHYKAAQKLIQQKDVIHQVAVHLPESKKTMEAKSTTINVLDEQISTKKLDVLSWEEALPDIVNMIKVDKVSNELINIVLLIIVSMGILNTMLMSVLERFREMGVLLAVGMRPQKLAIMVLCEGLILGVLGAFLGLILGYLASYSLVVSGLDLSAQMGESMPVGDTVTSTVIKGKYDWQMMGIYACEVVVLSVLSAIYPALKILNLHPVEAMRHH